MDHDSTPIASSRTIKSKLPAVRSKSVRWNLNTKRTYDSPTQGGKVESPDVVSRLSVALNNMRGIKDKLAETQAELEHVKEEKIKYETEHGRLYSQLSSLRTRSSLFESQLGKKSIELEDLKRVNGELEFECKSLRQSLSIDTTKQTNKTKLLEQQVRALKTELETQLHYNNNQELEHLQEANAKFAAELEKVQIEHSNELKSILEQNKSLYDQTRVLTLQVEENRAAMAKMGSEKSCLVHDLERLKSEHKKLLKTNKDAARLVELEELLAELETDRTNMKMAVKKAIAVIDEQEALKSILEEKDFRIKELEEQFEKLETKTAKEPNNLSLILKKKEFKIKELEHRLEAFESPSKEKNNSNINDINNYSSREPEALTAIKLPSMRLGAGLLSTKPATFSSPGDVPRFAKPEMPLAKESSVKETSEALLKKRLEALAETKTRLQRLSFD